MRSEFFRSVLVTIVSRDMTKVLGRYLKHCTRSLADDDSLLKKEAQHQDDHE